jgi:hypothetical protein
MIDCDKYRFRLSFPYAVILEPPILYTFLPHVVTVQTRFSASYFTASKTPNRENECAMRTMCDNKKPLLALSKIGKGITTLPHPLSEEGGYGYHALIFSRNNS